MLVLESVEVGSCDLVLGAAPEGNFSAQVLGMVQNLMHGVLSIRNRHIHRGHRLTEIPQSKAPGAYSYLHNQGQDPAATESGELDGSAMGQEWITCKESH